jgi:hypothetical protein
VEVPDRYEETPDMTVKITAMEVCDRYEYEKMLDMTV